MSFFHPYDKPLSPARGRRVIASFLTQGESIVAGYLSYAGQTWIDGAAPHARAHIEALSRAQEKLRQAWRNYRTGQVLARSQAAEAPADVPNAPAARVKPAAYPTSESGVEHWRRVGLAAARDRRRIMRRIDQATMLQPHAAAAPVKARKAGRPAAGAVIELAKRALESGNLADALATLRSYAP